MSDTITLRLEELKAREPKVFRTPAELLDWNIDVLELAILVIEGMTQGQMPSLGAVLEMGALVGRDIDVEPVGS